MPARGHPGCRRLRYPPERAGIAVAGSLTVLRALAQVISLSSTGRPLLGAPTRGRGHASDLSANQRALFTDAQPAMREQTLQRS